MDDCPAVDALVQSFVLWEVAMLTVTTLMAGGALWFLRRMAIAAEKQAAAPNPRPERAGEQRDP